MPMAVNSMTGLALLEVDPVLKFQPPAGETVHKWVGFTAGTEVLVNVTVYLPLLRQPAAPVGAKVALAEGNPVTVKVPVLAAVLVPQPLVAVAVVVYVPGGKVTLPGDGKVELGGVAPAPKAQLYPVIGLLFDIKVPLGVVAKLLLHWLAMETTETVGLSLAVMGCDQLVVPQKLVAASVRV